MLILVFLVPYTGSSPLFPSQGSSSASTISGAGPPVLLLSPVRGIVGSSIAVVGNGYAVSTTYTLCFSASTYSCSIDGASQPVTTNSSGSIPSGTTIAVPQVTGGGYFVDILSCHDLSCLVLAFAAFSVPPVILSISPVHGPVGTSITVSGSNLNASTTYALCFSTLPSTCSFATQLVMTTAGGAIPIGTTVTVPEVIGGGYFVDILPFGAFSIGAVGALASNLFSVVPQTLSLTPNTGPVASSITVSGNNYAPSTTYSLCFSTFLNGCSGGTQFTTDTSGNIPAGTIITVPSSAFGQNFVDVLFGNTVLSFASYVVQDFTISASPISASIIVGGAATSTITITAVNGFAGVVSLTSTVSPSTGLGCTLSPTSVTGSGSSTLSCTSSESGTLTVTVTGTSGTLSHSATFTVSVAVADFTVTASPTSVTTTAGTAATSTITVAPVNGFIGTVALTSSVTPAGLTCTLIPTGIALGASQTSTLSCSGPGGLYTVSVVATSGTITHTATVTYTVQDFTVATSPTSVSVNAEGAGTSTITIDSVSGFAGTVALTSSVYPAGLTCTLSQNSVIGSGSTIVTCSGSLGTYTVSVTGKSGSLSHTIDLSMTVTAPSQVPSKPSIFGLDPTIFYEIIAIAAAIVIASLIMAMRRRSSSLTKESPAE